MSSLSTSPLTTKSTIQQLKKDGKSCQVHAWFCAKGFRDTAWSKLSAKTRCQYLVPVTLWRHHTLLPWLLLLTVVYYIVFRCFTEVKLIQAAIVINVLGAVVVPRNNWTIQSNNHYVIFKTWFVQSDILFTKQNWHYKDTHFVWTYIRRGNKTTTTTQKRMRTWKQQQEIIVRMEWVFTAKY